MKVVFLLGLLAIIGALAMAGRAMLQGGRNGESDEPGNAKGKRMARALAWRVGLSIALFVFILISYQMGWIQPIGIPLAR